MNQSSSNWRMTGIASAAALTVLLAGCAGQAQSTSEEAPSPVPALETETETETPEPTVSVTDQCAPLSPAGRAGAGGQLVPSIATGPIPDGAVARLGRGRILALATSPDGAAMAVATVTGLVLYDASRLAEVWVVSNKRTSGIWWTESLAFSPDGSLIRASGPAWDQEAVKFFDASTGAEVPDADAQAEEAAGDEVEPPCAAALESSTILYNVFGTALSPDGRLLGATSLEGAAVVMDTCGCEVLSALSPIGTQWAGLHVGWLAPAPEGGPFRLVTAARGGTVDLRDPWGAPLGALRMAAGPQMAWSPDGALLAVEADTVAAVWNVSTGALEDIVGDEGPVGFSMSCIGACPGPTIFSIVWTGERSLSVVGNGPPETTPVWVEMAHVVEWAAGRGEQWHSFSGGPRHYPWLSPDGKLLVARVGDDITLIDVQSEQTVQTQTAPMGGIVGAVWSPDSVRVAMVSFHEISVWDAATGQEVAKLEIGLDWPPLPVWSPDGRTLAIPALRFGAEGNDTLVLWKFDSGELIPLAMPVEVVAPAWSPDGARIATGGEEDSVVVWDAATGEQLLRLAGHTRFILALAWSPDGARLASGSVDHTVILWDAATGQPLRTLAGHAPSLLGVDNLVWSPDGRLLASAATDGTVILWEMNSE